MKNEKATRGLISAAKRGDIPDMERQLLAGADVAYFSQEALRSAARAGHREAANYLCRHGAQLDEAVRYAASGGDVDAVVALIAYNKSCTFAKSLRAAFAQLTMLEAMDVPLEQAPRIPRKKLPPPGPGQFTFQYPPRP